MKRKQLKKHLPTVLFVLLFIAGLSLLLYPTVSNWWNSMHQSRAIATYSEQVAELDHEAYDKMLARAREYNDWLFRTGHTLGLTEEEMPAYAAELDVTGTGIMAYLEIPKISVYLPIYHGTSEGVLQVALGHIEGSSLPVGGENTHCVISGHRGLPSARLFTDLDQMELGDTFTVHTLNETLTYEVDQIEVVLPYEVDNLAIEEGEDLFTLVTCTPYGINSHRLLVRGHRVETPAAEAPAAEAAASAVEAAPASAPAGGVSRAALLVIPLLLLPALLLLWARRRGGKK